MHQHQSVLLNESIDALNIKPDGVYVDGTYGRGGHSKALLDQLNEKGRLIAFDKDLAAIQHAEEHFGADKRFSIVHDSFANIVDVAKRLNIYEKINGILLDLGVSSPQLDDADRGFSFMQDGPLDMRMDETQAFSAETFVNNASPQDLAVVFKDYGEERFAKRIANAIVREREKQPIKTTSELALIVKEANPAWEKHKHPATRVFQAIRIHVNEELKDLLEGLKGCVATLCKGGRLAVISFHSLEDRIVKRFLRDEETKGQMPVGVPVREADMPSSFKRVGKAIKPKQDEVVHNVRARSAMLRIGEKLA